MEREYEDWEIFWTENIDLNKSMLPGWQSLLKSNLAININTSKRTFDVYKNRWNSQFYNVPLDFLDLFLEHPDFNWQPILNLINESQLAKR